MRSLTHKTLPFLLALFVLVAGACDSTDPGDEDDGPGEAELITRVVISFTVGAQSFSVTAEDPDGDGTDFEIEPIRLNGGTTYTGRVQFFDDINDEELTGEVRAEGTEHQLFFTLTGPASELVSITRTDTDANGLPLGLEFQAVVGATGGNELRGTFNVVLSHYDAEPKRADVRSNETDVDVTFPLAVQ